MDNQKRILAIDIFRGLTMSMMILVNYPGARSYIYPPLSHAKWNGATPTDFIFPFFIFIVGVSVVLSLSRQIHAAKPRKEIVKKILIRGMKIYLIGFFLHYLPDFDFNKIDLFGVLQRISIVYVASAVLYLYTSWKTQLYIGGIILIGYWITLSFIPTDSFLAGTMEPGVNFAAWFDRLFFSAEMLGKHGWNPEGIYSTFPAIVTGITGMLAGRLIIVEKITEKTIIWLFIAGISCILAGSIWDWQFPINKKLWTSSFVLYTSGWATVALAFSLFFFDIRSHKDNPIARYGVIFGSNAIAVYVLADLFETTYKYTFIHDFVYGGLSDLGVSEVSASLVWALFSVGSCFVVAWILYKKQLFFKL